MNSFEVIECWLKTIVAITREIIDEQTAVYNYWWNSIMQGQAV